MTDFHSPSGKYQNLSVINPIKIGGVEAAQTEIPPLIVVKLGSVDTLDADGIVVGGTATAAKTYTATGALVTGGVATFDVPRCVRITSTGNEAGLTFTITGTDEYGEAMTQEITGPNAGTADSLKAFKTVSSVAVSGAVASTTGVAIGTCDKIGLPYKVATKGCLVGLALDGGQVALTPVVADTTAATATTGDVRGTISCTTAANGTIEWTVLIAPAAWATEADIKGVAQA